MSTEHSQFSAEAENWGYIRDTKAEDVRVFLIHENGIPVRSVEGRGLWAWVREKTNGFMFGNVHLATLCAVWYVCSFNNQENCQCGCTVIRAVVQIAQGICK